MIVYGIYARKANMFVFNILYNYTSNLLLMTIDIDNSRFKDDFFRLDTIDTKTHYTFHTCWQQYPEVHRRSSKRLESLSWRYSPNFCE